MITEASAVLERLLRANELGWMIDRDASPGEVIPALLERLDRVASEYHGRNGVAVPFTPEALEAEAEQNPHKVRAFLQALGASPSAAMLVMVWRILQGLSIREVEMTYREQEAFRLTVILAGQGDGQEVLEVYRSQDINDAALVRHFGIATISGRPLFDGFYPLRVK
jgi:hypothetical protein